MYTSLKIKKKMVPIPMLKRDIEVHKRVLKMQKKTLPLQLF